EYAQVLCVGGVISLFTFKWLDVLKSFTDYYHYTSRQQQLLVKALNILSLVEERARRLYADRRAHQRIDFQGLIVVSIPEGYSKTIEIYSGEMVTVLGRSISQSGISLVCPDHIPQEEIFVKLPLCEPIHTWFSSRIVRRRKILDDFWEYGVQFLGRIDV
ncbi:MAG: PilZ domain-containing protein, partial [Planctomycetota bacterium]